MTYSSLQDLFKISKALHFEYLLCPLCESEDYEEKIYLESYRIVKCRTCGFYFENPRPVKEDLHKLYDSSYFKFLGDHSLDNLEITKLNLRDIQFDDYERSLGNNKKRLLDIGCEKGTFMEYMKSRGWEVNGVEIGEQEVKYAKEKRGLNVFNGEVQDAKFTQDHFDVVNLSHLIEHVPNPLQVVKECHRILKKGGRIIIATDNIESLARYMFGRKWRGLIPIHIVFFSQKRMKKLLSDTGFKVTHSLSWGGLEKGKVSAHLKAVFDKSTKRLNVGDVMLVCAEKE